MRKDNFEYNYIKKTIKKPLIKRVKIDYKWLYIVSVASFVISVLFSLFAEITLPQFGLFVGLVILLIFIIINVLFDVIGVAIMVADIEQFHSLASKKIRGAKLGIRLITKKEHVASFCSDVVGDICGIISGASGLFISNYIAQLTTINQLFITIFVMSVIASLTIMSKAVGKVYATNLSNFIIYEFSKILSYFYRIQ